MPPPLPISSTTWPGRSDAIILAHGAGNDMNHPFMSYFHEAFARAGLLSVKFNFPYTEAGLKAVASSVVAAPSFAEAEQRLPAIAGMGFDVLYLAPIHPIGHTKRKGPNNSLVAAKDSPGSPWAIGNAVSSVAQWPISGALIFDASSLALATMAAEFFSALAVISATIFCASARAASMRD